VRILVEEASFVQVSKEVTSVVGMPPISLTANESIWELNTHDGASSPNPARLILAIPTNEAETMFLTTDPVDGSGIYEVGFRVQCKKGGNDTTPYGKISWVLS
jgi:predicted NAD/FAD-dependent oxidoreductase